MGEYIPSWAETKKFFTTSPAHMFAGAVLTAAVGISAKRIYDVAKGNEPSLISDGGTSFWNQKPLPMGGVNKNYMTRSTLSSMQDDVDSLSQQIKDDSTVPEWAEHHIYTAGDRINSVEEYMSHRKGLGATTSTSTTTSSSHPAIVREKMQEEANRYHTPSSGSMFGSQGFYGVSTSMSTTTAHLPPAARRRMATGNTMPSVTGTHLGKQMISDKDTTAASAISGASGMFALSGISPVMKGVWTE